MIDIKEKILEEYRNKNCYTCKHRGEVVGSAHSSCNKFLNTHFGLIALMTSAQGEVNPTLICLEGTDEEGKVISIPAQDWSEHGLREGWVIFPNNFDPCWLNYCIFHEVEQRVEDNVSEIGISS